MVVDDILGTGEADVRIGWNLPDLPFENVEGELWLNLEGSDVRIRPEGIRDRTALYRAGVLISGEELASDSSTYGWDAPTYALKQPALLWLRSAHGQLPMRGITTWVLAEMDEDEVDISWLDPVMKSPAFSLVEYRGRILET
jgi:hypothetical protein